MNIKTAIRERTTRGRPGAVRPLIAVSMGDAGGIGPEVTLKALSRKSVTRACRAFVAGDLEFLRGMARDLGLPVKLRKITDFGRITGNAVHVYDVARLVGKVIPGRPSATAGRAAGKALEETIKLALSGTVQGIVTAPVSKQSFAMAGYGMVGHTEILARLTGTRDYAMMLVSGGLRIVFATSHVPHRKVANGLTRRGLLKKIKLTHMYLALYLGIPNARIGITCLNPHCGEGARLGREEGEIIEPALKAARNRGICVEGPFPADSIYRPAIADGFDAILAMYHDQGMIPIKLKGHSEVVNITLGLPVVRTSPGHGTAFDIAGSGKASAASMAGAVLRCVRIVQRLDHAG